LRETFLRSEEQGMSIKPQPNHSTYLRLLRRMSPEQRLRKALELSDFAKQLFIQGMRKRFPDLPEGEFRALVRRRLDKCHNRSY
jgi:hypothetical protein